MPLPTIIFDVNETLLDLSALDPLFADAFGDKSVRRIWFAQLLQVAFSGNIIGSYQPFDELASAALDMTARKRGVALDIERKRRILRSVAAVPLHGDVALGLTTLRDAGYRLAVLTNSTEATVTEQLDHTKIRDLFDMVLSVDAVGRYKPAPETYGYACERLGVAPGDAMLVAAHDWDINGALAAGLQAGFVARHGTALNPVRPAPTLSAPSIRAIAELIVAREMVDRPA